MHKIVISFISTSLFIGVEILNAQNDVSRIDYNTYIEKVKKSNWEPNKLNRLC